MIVQPELLSIDEFAAQGGIKRTKAYELLKLSHAPRPISLGPKTIRYRFADCVQFWASLPTSERSAAEPTDLKRGRVFKCGQPAT